MHTSRNKHRRPIYADSGANGSIFRMDDMDVLTCVTIKGGQQVKYPDGNIVESVMSGTYQACEYVPEIVGDIFNNNDLENSLVAIHDYTKEHLAVILDEDQLVVAKKEHVIIEEKNVLLRSFKQRDEGLWTMPIPDSYPEQHGKIVQPKTINNIVRNQLDAPYVAFLHATYGSPSISTFIRAVDRGYLEGLPRLTPRMVRQNPPHSIALAKGHLDKRRMHYKSTSRKLHERHTIEKDPKYKHGTTGITRDKAHRDGVESVHGSIGNTRVVNSNIS